MILIPHSYFCISILWMVTLLKIILTQSVQSQTLVTAPGKENFQQGIPSAHHQRFQRELLQKYFWNYRYIFLKLDLLHFNVV